MTAALLAAAATWAWLRPATDIAASAPGRAAPDVLPGGRALVALAVAVAVVLSVGTPTLAALALVVAAFGWGAQRAWARRVQSRAADRTRQRVLECCELLAAELAAGQPAVTALAMAAEEWRDLAPVAHLAAYGGDVPSALRRSASRSGAADLRLVAAAWQVAHRTGLGLAEALSRVATSLRAARATQRVVQGELASARATARLVAALPVVALVIGSGSGGDPLGFLLTTLPGVVCLAAGLALALAGLAWIERIAGSAAR